MKIRLLSLAIALVAFMTSCDELKILNYDLDFVSASVTIGATTVADTTYALSTGMLDPKEELDKNGIDADLIKSSTIKSVTINLVSPDPGNFNWAKSAKVFMTAEGQPEKEIASVTDVPDGLQNLEIPSLDVDLTEFIQGGSFSFRVEASTDEAIPVDHEVTVTTVINVSLQ